MKLLRKADFLVDVVLCNSFSRVGWFGRGGGRVSEEAGREHSVRPSQGREKTLQARPGGSERKARIRKKREKRFSLSLSFSFLVLPVPSACHRDRSSCDQRAVPPPHRPCPPHANLWAGLLTQVFH